MHLAHNLSSRAKNDSLFGCRFRFTQCERKALEVLVSEEVRDADRACSKWRDASCRTLAVDWLLGVRSVWHVVTGLRWLCVVSRLRVSRLLRVDRLLCVSRSLLCAEGRCALIRLLNSISGRTTPNWKSIVVGFEAKCGRCCGEKYGKSQSKFLHMMGTLKQEKGFRREFVRLSQTLGHACHLMRASANP